MRSLFDFAYAMAVDGHEWAKHPPVLLSGEGSDARLKGQASESGTPKD